MSKVDDIKSSFLAQMDALDHKLLAFPTVQLVQEKTNIRPAIIAIVVAVILSFLAMFQLGSHALCEIVGFLYPLYASFQAVKTPEIEDDGFWLTYWIIFSLFTLVESLTDIILESFPLGLYWVSKVAFLVWCFLPQTKGAKLIYDRVIDPILRRFETRIDENAAKFSKGASRVAGDVRKDAVTAGGMATGIIKRKAAEAVVDSIGKGGEAPAAAYQGRPSSASNAGVPQAPDMHTHAQ